MTNFFIIQRKYYFPCATCCWEFSKGKSIGMRCEIKNETYTALTEQIATTRTIATQYLLLSKVGNNNWTNFFDLNELPKQENVFLRLRTHDLCLRAFYSMTSNSIRFLTREQPHTDECLAALLVQGSRWSVSYDNCLTRLFREIRKSRNPKWSSALICQTDLTRISAKVVSVLEWRSCGMQRGTWNDIQSKICRN